MSTIGLSETSKTYQYRKVMKPMLERKRRARINKCLDELKDLMVATLESEGEHVTRLEKADILELTVTHLHKIKQQRRLLATAANANGGGRRQSMTQAEGFRSGYIHAVNEVSRTLSELPTVNENLGTKLMTHLGQRLNQLQPPVQPPLPITSPLSVHISSGGSGSITSPLSTASSNISNGHQHHQQKQPTSAPLLLAASSNSSLLTTCNPSAKSCGSVRRNSMTHRVKVHERRSQIEPGHKQEAENVWRPW